MLGTGQPKFIADIELAGPEEAPDQFFILKKHRESNFGARREKGNELSESKVVEGLQ